MRKNITILFLLVITIAGGILLYSWNTQQKDKTGFQFMRKKKSSSETEKHTHLFSTEISKDGALMVLIPKGEFFMGNLDEDDFHYDEHPLHKVHLDSFWIDCYEVTNRFYKRFVDETGYRSPYLDAEWAETYNWKDGSYPSGKADYPVVLVSWEDAAAYAEWADKRLPTEAEWEKAARGGLVKKHYPWGDKIDEIHANYFTSIISKNEMKPVGNLLPNSYGIYDIAGNVWEWCADWYGKTYYRTSPYKNPQGPEKGIYRVFRGGSWIKKKEFLRCSERARNVPTHRSYTIGFRCAKSYQGSFEGVQAKLQ
jgi:formylglycine-generating enzyme required for sulfatase activity